MVSEKNYCMKLPISQERVETLLHTASYVAPKLVFILVAQKLRCSRTLWSLQSINEAFWNTKAPPERHKVARQRITYINFVQYIRVTHESCVLLTQVRHVPFPSVSFVTTTYQHPSQREFLASRGSARDFGRHGIQTRIILFFQVAWL